MHCDVVRLSADSIARAGSVVPECADAERIRASAKRASGHSGGRVATLPEAWRMFVASGKLAHGVVRPEIERSWLRCRASGVNPWSYGFPQMDEPLLVEKRRMHRAMSQACLPMMQLLASLLDCSVSLMDGENFVYEFISPRDYYPHNLGTFAIEELMGTGNATIVPYEMAPVRVDGYEHYRVCSRVYSGVSAPFVSEEGVYGGAINANDAAGRLPAWALQAVSCAVREIEAMAASGAGRNVSIASGAAFRSVAECVLDPVVILDSADRIVYANALMRPYVEGHEAFSVGSQAFSAYLENRAAINDLVADSFDAAGMPLVGFRRKGGAPSAMLAVVSSNAMIMPNGATYRVIRFSEDPEVFRTRLSSVGMDIGVGEDPEWRKVDALVRKVAPVRANVLILGETGSGKEVVARALHRLSGRKGNFVAINCGAIPRDLFAAELFGYERSAFTGARESGAPGKIEAADGGTLFLDEIGEMPMDLQVSLLRALQTRSVVRLGSNTVRTLDVRFVAATNADVSSLIEEGRFRNDLYFRLSMVEVAVPPLRQRSSDIPLLAEFFNRTLCEELGFAYAPLCEDVIAALAGYSWPGNVRELRNAVERLLIASGGPANAQPDELPAHIGRRAMRKCGSASMDAQVMAREAASARAPRAAHYKRWSFEEKLACARMRVEAGVSLSDVSRRFGADVSQISRWAAVCRIRSRSAQAPSLNPSRPLHDYSADRINLS